MNEQENGLHKMPDEKILEILEESSARLPYIETKLKSEIKIAKNGGGESDREFLKKELERLEQRGFVQKNESNNEDSVVYSLTESGIDSYHKDFHRIPVLQILQVFNEMRRASLLYLETELKSEIKTAKNGSGETDREFLKKELERLKQKKLISEIESHSDALRAYFLTAEGFEEYCYRHKRTFEAQPEHANDALASAG